jgi:hypothetical protein
MVLDGRTVAPAGTYRRAFGRVTQPYQVLSPPIGPDRYLSLRPLRAGCDRRSSCSASCLARSCWAVVLTTRTLPFAHRSCEASQVRGLVLRVLDQARELQITEIHWNLLATHASVQVTPHVTVSHVYKGFTHSPSNSGRSPAYVPLSPQNFLWIGRKNVRTSVVGGCSRCLHKRNPPRP